MMWLHQPSVFAVVLSIVIVVGTALLLGLPVVHHWFTVTGDSRSAGGMERYRAFSRSLGKQASICGKLRRLAFRFVTVGYGFQAVLLPFSGLNSILAVLQWIGLAIIYCGCGIWGASLVFEWRAVGSYGQKAGG